MLQARSSDHALRRVHACCIQEQDGLETEPCEFGAKDMTDHLDDPLHDVSGVPGTRSTEDPNVVRLCNIELSKQRP